MNLGDRLAVQGLLLGAIEQWPQPLRSLGGEARAPGAVNNGPPAGLCVKCVERRPGKDADQGVEVEPRGEGVPDPLDGGLQALTLTLQVLEPQSQPVDPLGAVPRRVSDHGDQRQERERKPREAGHVGGRAGHDPDRRQSRVQRPDLRQDQNLDCGRIPDVIQSLAVEVTSSTAHCAPKAATITCHGASAALV